MEEIVLESVVVFIKYFTLITWKKNYGKSCCWISGSKQDTMKNKTEIVNILNLISLNEL